MRRIAIRGAYLSAGRPLLSTDRLIAALDYFAHSPHMAVAEISQANPHNRPRPQPQLLREVLHGGALISLRMSRCTCMFGAPQTERAA